jgi:hypothetical protein
MPYCNFATIGLSEMKVKSLRRQVNGRGTMRARKMNISVTNRRKTCNTIIVSMEATWQIQGRVARGHASSNTETSPLASSLVVAARRRLVRRK